MRRKKLRSGDVTCAAPRPPTLKQRIKSAAEFAARDVVNEHPRVKALRTQIERRVQTAVKGALRDVRSAR